MNKIRNSIEDRQSRLTWYRINKLNGRMNTLRPRLKATNQEEELHKMKEHFKNLLRYPREINDKLFQSY